MEITLGAQAALPVLPGTALTIMISTPNKLQEISQSAFAAFLLRLAPDAEQAGEAYEELRQMLVKFFECRGQQFAEDLTDEVFNRVMRRLAEGEQINTISGYCYSIARFILLEQSRSPERHRIELTELPLVAETTNDSEEEDTQLNCLHSCLQSLSKENRDLILEYYQDEKRSKIDLRQQMAARLGISRNALATRMVRLRDHMEKCVKHCLKKNSIAATQIRKS